MNRKRFLKIKMSLLKGGIKSWILFILILLGMLGALYGIRKYEEKGAPVSSPQEESQKTRKPFARSTLSEEEKELQDEKNLKEAMLKGSAESCEALLNADKKQACLDQIRFTSASRGEDPEACLSLPEPLLSRCQDQIYLRLALHELEVTLCENIHDEALKLSCQDQLKSLLGTSETDPSFCDSIQNPTVKTQCLDRVYANASLEKSNAESCKKITDPDQIRRCEAGVAQNQRVLALAAKKPLRTLESAEEKAERCESAECLDQANFELALAKKDMSFCEKITDDQKRNECFSTNGTYLNRFYLQEALKKRDNSFCQKINQEPLRLSCLQFLSP